MNLPDIEQRIEELARNEDLSGGYVTFRVEIGATCRDGEIRFRPVSMQLYTHKLGTVADNRQTVEECFEAVSHGPKAKLERIQQLESEAAALRAELPKGVVL